MKFGLFYQGQLPKPLDSDDWEPGQELKLFQDILTQIEFADRLGFDYIWVAEHHFSSEYNHITASDVMLGAIAARTKSIRLGPCVVQMMPGNNHPVKVAENIATIDLISNGRIEFGVGVGAQPEQLMFWPQMEEVIKEGRTHAVLTETLSETLKMMTMTPYPGHEGEYVTVPPGNVVPKPVQQPHPPLWLAVTSDRSLKLAAERGMGALCLAQGGPEVVRNRVVGYWQTIRNGVDPIGLALNPVVCSFTAALVAATDEQARMREASGQDWTNYAIHRSHELVRTTGHINREFVALQKERERELADAALAAVEGGVTTAPPGLTQYHKSGSTKGMLDSSPDSPATVIGSPETARKRLLGFEDTGIDIMAFTQQVGMRRHEDIMESLEHLGNLLPEFKDRHERGRQAREDRFESLGLPVNASV